MHCATQWCSRMQLSALKAWAAQALHVTDTIASVLGHQRFIGRDRVAYDARAIHALRNTVAARGLGVMQ